MWLLVTRAGADKDQDPEPWSGVRDWLRLGTWTPRQGHPLRVGPTGEESSLSQLHPLSPPRGSWCPSTVGPVSPNLASMKTCPQGQKGHVSPCGHPDSLLPSSLLPSRIVYREHACGIRKLPPALALPQEDLLRPPREFRLPRNMTIKGSLKLTQGLRAFQHVLFRPCTWLGLASPGMCADHSPRCGLNAFRSQILEPPPQLGLGSSGGEGASHCCRLPPLLPKMPLLSSLLPPPSLSPEQLQFASWVVCLVPHKTARGTFPYVIGSDPSPT